MAIALAASDPLLEGIEGAEAVVLERSPATWTVVVGGRRVTVAPPRTPDDEMALRALVRTLLVPAPLEGLGSGPEAAARALRLLAPPPAPAPPPVPAAPAPVVAAPVVAAPVVAVEPPPAPPPEPTPVAAPVPVVAAPPAEPPVPAPPAPSPLPPAPLPAPPVPSAAWVGPGLTLRQGLDPGFGVVGGLDVGDTFGAGVRLGAWAARGTVWGPATELREQSAAVVGFAELGPVRGFLGPALALRTWRERGAPVDSHVMPTAQLGVSVPLDLRAVRVEPRGGLEVDLFRTKIGVAGAFDDLSRVGVRAELVVGSNRIAGSRHR